jgi:hypothetical protein
VALGESRKMKDLSVLIVAGGSGFGAPASP